MSFGVTIEDRKTNNTVTISKNGQLIVRPIFYSTFYTALTVSNNVPVNVIEPRTGKDFVITALTLAGDRSIGNDGALVEIYESDIGPTEATILNTIYADDIAKQTRAILSGINILVPSARWVNVKSDDVGVRVNLAGYYLPIES